MARIVADAINISTLESVFRAHLNALVEDFRALGDIESIDWLPQHTHMLTMRRGRLRELSDTVQELGLDALLNSVEEVEARFGGA